MTQRKVVPTAVRNVVSLVPSAVDGFRRILFVTCRDDPMGKTCRICKIAIDPFYNYCTTCAYKKGICARCGRKIQDTKLMKLSNK